MASPLNQRAGQPLCLCGRGGIGRHARLKILFLYRSAGSIPAARTKTQHKFGKPQNEQIRRYVYRENRAYF